MHISDGILSPAVTIGAYALTFAVTAWSVKTVDQKDLPKVAVVTSSFFVASLINIPLGPTSIHLLLPGLVGVLLGPAAFLSILVGLTLQCILFQYGGLTSLGANTFMMGIPAICSGLVFQKFKGKTKRQVILMGALSSVFGTVLSAVFLAVLLASAGEDFYAVAKFALAAHVPVFVLEGIIAGFTISFLYKVKPELLIRKLF